MAFAMSAKMAAAPFAASKTVAPKPATMTCPVATMFGRLSVSSRVSTVSNGATAFMKGGRGNSYNVQVVPGENEPGEAALRRFRRAMMNSQVIQEVRRRRYFEDPQDIKKRKAKEAGKRRRFQNRTRSVGGLARALARDPRDAANQGSGGRSFGRGGAAPVGVNLGQPAQLSEVREVIDAPAE